MATLPQPYLFSWKEIDAASDLDRLRLVLDALPDESLVSFLEQRRGRGRNDYPVRPMWNAVISGIVFQHPLHDEQKSADPDGRRDTDADWGRKIYIGGRKDGTTWEKVVKWFGYKLHLLVDSVYELPLALEIDKASSSDMKHLTTLVEDLKEHHEQLHAAVKELSTVLVHQKEKERTNSVSLHLSVLKKIAPPSSIAVHLPHMILNARVEPSAKASRQSAWGSTVV